MASYKSAYTGTQIDNAINKVTNNVYTKSETDNAIVTAVKAEINQFKTVVLYNNSNGTQSDITLSDSAANYDYIEIFYRADGAYYASQKLFDPNGKSVHLYISSAYSPENTVMTFTGCVTFSGTSMTWMSNGDSFFYINSSKIPEMVFNRVLYVHKIIGYLPSTIVNADDGQM